jgi:cytoskeleton protein RodZ
VVIRVRGESWVQIRDNSGNRVLMDRVLRAGEIIEIPNRPGIVLTTGKAENLEILLDGQDVDPFGGPGVRRNIVLEPDRLRPPPTQANTPAPAPRSAPATPPRP